MVSIAVSKMVMTELVFVVPRMKVNGQYYRDVLLSQPDAASDHACCKRYVCLSTRQRSTSSYKDNIKQLQQETPDLIGLDLWPKKTAQTRI